MLAVWGAVVSTVALIWHLVRDITDQGKLEVTCYLGRLVGGLAPDHRMYLVYRVTNVGRRAVNVTHIGGAMQGKEHFMMNTRTVPRTLQPSEYFIESFPDLSVLDKSPRE